MADASPSPSPTAEPAADAGQSESKPQPTTFFGDTEVGVVDATRKQTLVNPPGYDEAQQETAPPEPPEDAPEQLLSKIEQKYKVLQGMHKGLEAEAKQGKEAKGLYLQQRATAEQMAATIIQLQQQLANVVPSQPKAGVEPESVTPARVESMADQALASIDSNMVEQIMETQGATAAYAWTMQQALKVAEKHFKSNIEAVKQELLEKLQPYEQRDQAEAITTAAQDLFVQVNSYVNDRNGEPAFPELKDPEAAERVVRMWHNQTGWTPEYKFSPQGVLAAIALYRSWKAYNDSAPPQPQPPPETMHANLDLDATVAPPSRLARPRTLADQIRDNYRNKADEAHIRQYGYPA